MNLKDLQKKINKLTLKIKDKELQKIGNELVKEIKIRTIDGYGVEGTEAAPFRPLKPKTIKARSKSKDLDGRTSPETSNQIHTGALVDGIKSYTKDNVIEIKPQANRKDGRNGNKVAKAQENMGRTIFKLEEEQVEEIKEKVKALIIADIEKSLK